MEIYTSAKKIEAICKETGAIFHREKEQGKTVYRIAGFLADIQAATRQIHGYYVEQGDQGHRLYRMGLSWE